MQLRMHTLTGLCLAALAALPLVTACDGGGTAGAGGTGNSGGTGGMGNAGGTGGSAGTGGSTGGGGNGGGVNPACTDAPGAPPALQLTMVNDQLVRPVALVHAPGDAPTRVFVVEQPGTIQIMENGVLNAAPFLDINNVVQGGTGGGDERGLLGLAFHPDYATNGRFFVYYTGNGTGMFSLDFTIAEYHRSDADPNVADTGEVQQLMKVGDPFGNHNGGQLAFGPDGYLYAGVGDGGDAGDPLTNSQNLMVRFGKILRLDVENHPTPPPGNYAGADQYVWDIGLRNPWRFSFDNCTGRLYIGDVGQGSQEEVDIEEPGMGNKNYGWDCKEGDNDFEPNNCNPGDVLTPPVETYSHSNGNCSINGGFVYRGAAIPALWGHYFYSDYCSGRIWSFRWDGAAVQDSNVHNDIDPGMFEASAFGEDGNGEIYVLTLGGTVYRIDPA